MSDSDIWYGFLQAGGKSSPVVRDPGLKTGNNKTIYLYNQARGQFVEYSSEIVAPKLRELKSEDVSLADLKRAFKAARKVFLANRVTRIRETTPERMGTVRGNISGDSLLITSKDDIPGDDQEDDIGDDAYG
jgi:hypothetical protein